MARPLIAFLIFATYIVFPACGKFQPLETSTALESASEITGAVLTGAVNGSEVAGTPDSGPVSGAPAATACPTFQSGFECVKDSSPAQIKLLFANCSFNGSTATWNGSQTFQLMTQTCSATTTILPSFDGQTATRTWTAGTTRTTSDGIIVTIDTTTANSSGWDSGVTGLGNGETIAFDSNFSGNGKRTALINGIHLTAQTKDSAGALKERWNATLSSAALTVTGLGSSRLIKAGGSVIIQDNVSKLTGTAKITTDLSYGGVTTTANPCCHPVGGVITTTITTAGTKKGATETLTYQATCGTAILVDTAGVSSSVTLRHCF